MKLPRRSLAYFWAKTTLNRAPPSWVPLLSIGVALFAGALWFSAERKSGSLLIVAVCSLVGAAEAWHMRGMRAIFAEQQRLLEEAREKKNA
jgi:hypothetical protein